MSTSNCRKQFSYVLSHFSLKSVGSLGGMVKTTSQAWVKSPDSPTPHLERKEGSGSGKSTPPVWVVLVGAVTLMVAMTPYIRVPCIFTLLILINLRGNHTLALSFPFSSRRQGLDL